VEQVAGTREKNESERCVTGSEVVRKFAVIVNEKQESIEPVSDGRIVVNGTVRQELSVDSGDPVVG